MMTIPEPKVWLPPKRHATMATLLLLDWARVREEAKLAAAVAERLSRPGNEYPPSMLVSLAVKLAADLVRNHVDEDEFQRYVADAFDPTGPTLAAADLVRAARVADDLDALRAVVDEVLRGYGAIHAVVVACQCLRSATAFVHPDRPGAVLEDAASLLAGKLFAEGGNL